jgi:plasmid stabilization system protein ParE
VNVHWTDTAVAHVCAIRDHIARDSAVYGQATADRIVGRSQALAQFPLSGAEVPEYADESIREVLEHPYRIIYRVMPIQVDIVAVIHSARRLPRTPPG